MKTFVGVPVWNRVDQIIWLIDGITSNFAPHDTTVAFYFDACTDGSLEHFNCVRDRWLTAKGYSNYVGYSETEIREVGGHNRLLDLFMHSTECDVAIIAQDDQMFKQPVAANVHGVYGQYHNLGIVGGRDGYDKFYRDMASSEWSTSKTDRHLKHGEFAFKTLLNSGPVCYHRKTIEKVGYLDEDFTAFYVWDDYCMRAMKSGLINVVMGMDIAHKKIGRGSSSTFYTSEISQHDLGLLHSKHGKLF